MFSLRQHPVVLRRRHLDSRHEIWPATKPESRAGQTAGHRGRTASNRCGLFPRPPLHIPAESSRPENQGHPRQLVSRGIGAGGAAARHRRIKTHFHPTQPLRWRQTSSRHSGRLWRMETRHQRRSPSKVRGGISLGQRSDGTTDHGPETLRRTGTWRSICRDCRGIEGENPVGPASTE